MCCASVLAVLVRLGELGGNTGTGRWTGLAVDFSTARVLWRTELRKHMGWTDMRKAGELGTGFTAGNLVIVTVVMVRGRPCAPADSKPDADVVDRHVSSTLLTSPRSAVYNTSCSWLER